uniref:Uncharacterized protein n=2 Tax=Cyprinus carpio TaxID=7962 RepID=A0A9J8CTA4_CYPCA
MWDHSNQEQLLSSSQNEKALWRRNHSPTWLRSINLMSGCTCRLFIPVCTEGWLRYAKFTSQNSLAFSLKVIADWSSQVNPLCRYNITRSDQQTGNSIYLK